jgi:ATP-dependent protease ClpP protease subunit
MSFRVEHQFTGIRCKPDNIVIPQLIGQLKKAGHWEPIVCELCDDVDATSAQHIAEKLRQAEEAEQPFVPFFIHSNGGEVYSLMSIVESMRRCKIPIYTFVSGYAASCAACIFSCGQKRFMARHARLLIHDVSVDFSQESAMTSSNLKTEAKEMRSLNKTIFQIMAENCGHDKNFFINLVKNKRNNDIYVGAAQALEWKLATDIGYPVVKVRHETTMSLDFLRDECFTSKMTHKPTAVVSSDSDEDSQDDEPEHNSAHNDDEDDDEDANVADERSNDCSAEEEEEDDGQMSCSTQKVQANNSQCLVLQKQADMARKLKQTSNNTVNNNSTTHTTHTTQTSAPDLSAAGHRSLVLLPIKKRNTRTTSAALLEVETPAVKKLKRSRKINA